MMIEIPQAWTAEMRLDLARSLAFINNALECGPFRMWLKKAIERLDYFQRYEADETRFRQRQGAVVTVAKLLETIESGDDLFRGFRDEMDAFRK